MINEREREDYHRPSSSLFRSFIQSDLVDRYALAPTSPLPPLITHTTVTSVSHEVVHVPGREPEQGFVVRSTRPDGTDEVRGARAVVLAIGPSCAPSVPRVIREAAAAACGAQESASEGPGAGPWSKADVCGEGWCHSTAFAIPGCGPMDGPLGERVRQGKPARVVVLGGGCVRPSQTRLARRTSKLADSRPRSLAGSRRRRLSTRSSRPACRTSRSSAARTSRSAPSTFLCPGSASACLFLLDSPTTRRDSPAIPAGTPTSKRWLSSARRTRTPGTT